MDKKPAENEAKRIAERMMCEYAKGFRIDKVTFIDECTIVNWGDGTTTSVKCCECDSYDAEKAIALCVMKKMYGPQFKKALKNYTKNLQEGYTPSEQLLYN